MAVAGLAELKAAEQCDTLTELQRSLAGSLGLAPGQVDFPGAVGLAVCTTPGVRRLESNENRTLEFVQPPQPTPF